MTGTSTTRHPRWLRVIPGCALLIAPGVVAVSAWDAVITGNAWLPITLALSAVLGLWLLVSGLRTTTPPRGVHDHTVQRVFGLIAGLTLAALLFWLQPHSATSVALAAQAMDSKVTVTDSRSAITFEPSAPAKAGLVLYPGAKVDPRAYSSLARRVSALGYRVVVPKCAYNIALMCPNAADPFVTDDIPWAVGGHSLGGIAAADYAADHPLVDGLVLWGSYSTTDLSDRKGLLVTSISGSNDGLSTLQDIDSNRSLLPTDTNFIEINGGVHAYFGDYGIQPGDGVPAISREQAQKQIVASTTKLLAALSDQESSRR